MVKRKFCMPFREDLPARDQERSSGGWLYINVDTMKALKYIAFTDDATRTDIINEALVDYIAKWEKKNGPIPKKG